MMRISVLFLLLFQLYVGKANSLNKKETTELFPIKNYEWIYDYKLKGNRDGLLWKMKMAEEKRQWKRCLFFVQKSYEKLSVIQHWIALKELDCLVKGLQEGKVSVSQVQKRLSIMRKRPSSFFSNFTEKEWKKKWFYTSVEILSKQMKRVRQRTWKEVDKLLPLRLWAERKTLARFYKLLGELAFVQQKLELAYHYSIESLKLDENAELKKKILSLQKVMGISKEKVGVENEIDQLEVTKEERGIVVRMTDFLEEGNFGAAIGEGISLIEKFPGGKRARWAENRLWDIYLKLKGKNDLKWKRLRSMVLAKIARLPGDRGARWVARLFRLGRYEDVYSIGDRTLSHLRGTSLATKTLLTVARSLHFLGRYDKAYEYYSRLIRFHGGTWESLDARFRMSLIEIRRGKNSSAVSHLERLLVLPGGEDYRLSSKYWLWRILQKENSIRAQEMAKSIMNEFPVTYYGLRVRHELEGSIKRDKLFFKGKNKKSKKKIYVFSWQQQLLKRVKILADGGWLKEARKELSLWTPLPSVGDEGKNERVFLARVYSSLLMAQKSTYLIRGMEGGEYRSLFLVPFMYPLFFHKWIQEEGEKRQVNELLIKSLIRQESHWYVEAKSSSNAKGLMQLIPGTARDVMGWLKLKGDLDKVLYSPQLNIRMGVYYLSRQIKKFDDYVPVALAAYNAGPTRLKRWLTARNDTGDWKELSKKSPYDMLWVDEMPWKETRGYVKGILRNMIVYSVLEKGSVSLDSPIWE